VEHAEPAAEPRAQDAGLRNARAQLVRDEEFAQETQRQINEAGTVGGGTPEPNESEEWIVDGSAPKRKEKLFLVTLTQSWRGLREHLMGHALLEHCAEELNNAGLFNPPVGVVFTLPEHYRDSIAAFPELMAKHILVTKPFLRAVIVQVKAAPRAENNLRRRVTFIRNVKLLGNSFGPDGVERRTTSTFRSKPSDFRSSDSIIGETLRDEQ
jgi:hypothetical protein